MRASDFALRTQHELGDHDRNCCLTLTYEDSKLPSISDQKSEFQLFLKRLRERVKKKISYLCSHEYGGKKGRLHHHALIFGADFPDMRPWKTTPKGTQLYSSRLLQSIWKNGWANIGEAKVEAGYYIASYALKNSKHQAVDEHGELVELKDTMSISKRPGIGYNYLRRHHREMVLRGDYLPRYYRKKMGEILDFDLDKLSKLSPSEINLRFDMLHSLEIYEANQEFKIRSPREIYVKSQLLRSKLKNEGELRKKPFCKSENIDYQYYKEKFTDSLTVENL